MSDKWYFVQNGQRNGPVSVDELGQLAVKGRLQPDDLVWTKGMAAWAPASEVAGLYEDEPPPIPKPDLSALVHVPDFPKEEYIMGEDGPVPADEYSPTWNFIKRRMREMGLGYMLDTPEKRKRVARHMGGIVGLGASSIGYRVLKTLGIVP